MADEARRVTGVFPTMTVAPDKPVPDMVTFAPLEYYSWAGTVTLLVTAAL